MSSIPVAVINHDSLRMEAHLKPRILGLIPARGGSKRLPGKNILPLGGRPLIEWTIDAAQKSGVLCSILLSTDDPAIADVGRNAGALAPWL
ncbi:MAG: cytidylyltransferase domain-containing protein, partial [Burkholderiales bacterium]